MSSYGWDPVPPGPPVPAAYRKIKEDLLEVLQSLESEGSFAYADTLEEYPNPGLEIDGLGPIGLPLSAREAQVIISKCHLSPFGKGEQTLTDASVRSSWELDASQFEITNPAWEECLDSILEMIYAQLGLNYGIENVEAELYKLLIYQKGAFFKSHQDSEKAEGMFGTLVISLPSQHEGGKVVLRHNGVEEEFDSAEAASLDLSYAAWYSDIHHEVEEVISGYRVVLTYNLIQYATDVIQSPPDGSNKRRLVEVLEIFEKELVRDTEENTENSPGYLIHRLDHLYTEHSLKAQCLKGEDAQHFQSLLDACETAGFDLYLGSLEKEVAEDIIMPGAEAYRKEVFSYVSKPDGIKTELKPVFNYRNLLVEVETDEGHAAGYEEDEYTGNEGSMATWKYKISTVIIVAPSRKLEFEMSHNNKLTDAFSIFPKLWEDAKGDVAAKEKLYNLCLVVIRAGKPKDYWDKPDSAEAKQRKECMHQVVLAAIEYGWLHLVDQIFLEQSQSSEHFAMYSNYVARNDTEHRLDSL